MKIYKFLLKCNYKVKKKRLLKKIINNRNYKKRFFFKKKKIKYFNKFGKKKYFNNYYKNKRKKYNFRRNWYKNKQLYLKKKRLLNYKKLLWRKKNISKRKIFFFFKNKNKYVKYSFNNKFNYYLNFLKYKKLNEVKNKKKIMPLKNILFLLKKFLEYFLLNIFKIKNILINFFEKSSYRLSSRYLKRFIKFEIYKKGYRVNHIINLIKKDLTYDVTISGYKLGFFGRYQKKLRNKDFYKIKGPLAPSNLSSLVSYENFAVLLKQGITGIELNIIKKMKKNEIF